jgi:hypothetical protein
LLRAAAVGGTAYAVGKNTQRRRSEQEAAYTEQDQRISDLEQRQASASRPAAPPQPAGPSLLDQLNQLAELHQQGALTDEEFAAAKAKLLG